MEKGNPMNVKNMGHPIVLDWQQRGQLVDLLKEMGTENLIVMNKELLTKRMQKEFNIL